jgi:integrase
MHEVRPGVWRLRVYVGHDPVTGRKRHQSQTFHGSKRKAENALATLVDSVAKGNHGGPSTVTVSGLLDAYCDHCENVGKSRVTVDGYRRIADSLRDGIGRTRLAKLRAEDLDELYAILGSRGVDGGRGPMSSASVRRHHALVAAACAQAVKWGWLERNPALRATAPSAGRSKVTTPSPAELQRLIGATENPQHGLLIALAAMTGARRGELCGLRWSDIDFATGVLHIRRAVKQIGRDVFEGDTKTHQERRVALPLEAVKPLRAFRRGLGRRAAAIEIPLARDPYVFSPAADHGKPYAPHSITQMFDRIARKCRLPYHVHQLRHFAATQMVGAGHDPVTVAARLGHADPSVTLRVYAKALEDRDRAAGDTLGQLVLPS